MTDEQFAARYQGLAHALQTGVAETQRLDDAAVRTGHKSSTGIPTSPKMLRTGVNMAMVEQSAVARLLIEKGVFTTGEYQTALVIGLEQEVEKYEQELSARLGAKVGLA